MTPKLYEKFCSFKITKDFNSGGFSLNQIYKDLMNAFQAIIYEST